MPLLPIRKQNEIKPLGLRLAVVRERPVLAWKCMRNKDQFITQKTVVYLHCMSEIK